MCISYIHLPKAKLCRDIFPTSVLDFVRPDQIWDVASVRHVTFSFLLPAVYVKRKRLCYLTDFTSSTKNLHPEISLLPLSSVYCSSSSSFFNVPPSIAIQLHGSDLAHTSRLDSYLVIRITRAQDTPSLHNFSAASIALINLCRLTTRTVPHSTLDTAVIIAVVTCHPCAFINSLLRFTHGPFDYPVSAALSTHFEI